jgi:hypothetical protein
MRQADAIIETQIATLPDVREWKEEMPVELWVNRANRLVLRTYNEDGHNSTEIDVFDLLHWLTRESGFFGSSPFTSLSVA